MSQNKKNKFSLRKNPTIAHIINPFKCSEDNPSYLYYAQPITFKSMQIAKLEAQKLNINVTLYAINFPEDDVIVPDYFLKLPNLKKSTLSEFPKLSAKKKLPIIQEIFDSILNNTIADYIIYTNVDIGVQKNFYNYIYKLITKDNLDSFIINRRDNIPKFIFNKRLTEKELDLIYKEKGIKHSGKDCFIISRKILNKVNMKKMFTGYAPWGNTLYELLKKINPETYLFKDEYLTFHLGMDRSIEGGNGNKKSPLFPLFKKNLELSKTVLPLDIIIFESLKIFIFKILVLIKKIKKIFLYSYQFIIIFIKKLKNLL